jgi:hypothetical protein
MVGEVKALASAGERRRKVPLKKPRSERLADDAYITPFGHALSICRWLDGVIPTPKRIIEPSSGSGSFVRAARSVWPKAHIIAVDVRGEVKKSCYDAGADEFVKSTWEDYADFVGGRGVDLIVGNPPYLYAERHARIGHRELVEGKHLCFLLRQSFLAGQKRARDFWPKHPLFALGPIADRPSFTPDGCTDGAEYAAFLFQQGYQGAPRISRHIWSLEAQQRNHLRIVRADDELIGGEHVYDEGEA